MNVELILIQQKQLLDKLLLLLDDEKIALEQDKAEDLIELSKHKNSLLNELENNDQQLAKHDQRESLKLQPELIELRESINKALLSCQDKNELLEQIMNAASQKTRTQREFLQQIHGGNSTTYDKAGQKNIASRLGKDYTA